MGGINKLRRLLAGLALLNCIGMTSAWGRFEPPPACKNPFTPEQEIAEGGKVAAQVYKQMPVLPDSDPVSRYVESLGMKLAANAPGRQWPYNFHVVASSDINAFALPGGTMFVNLGTVQAAETEAQLAGVMAHELSHVVLRHSTCNLAKQQKKGLLYGLGSLASAMVLGNSGLGSVAQAGIGSVQGLDYLHMSRDDEKQADLLGVGILYDTGYDPRGLPQFFETIQAKYGGGGAQLLSDHPNPGNRTEYVNAEIATLPPRQRPVVTSTAFTQVHAIAKGDRVYTAKEVQAGVWKQAGRYAAGPGGGVMTVGSQDARGEQGGAVSNQAGQAGGAQPLSDAALGLHGKTTAYQGAFFSVRYPAAWQVSGDANGRVLFAPAGGAGAAGVGYGVLVDRAKEDGEGVSDAASLEAATRALADQLSKENGGLELGGMKTLTVGGQRAEALEMRGRSPVAEGGSALAERDWLVTVARPDGDLSYLVFVAPDREFERLKPTFDAMLASFKSP